MPKASGSVACSSTGAAGLLGSMVDRPSLSIILSAVGSDELDSSSLSDLSAKVKTALPFHRLSVELVAGM